MPFTKPYQSRYHALKPISILLTLSIVLVSMILGSIMAVVLSWAWLLFTATMLAVEALRLRLKSSKVPASTRTPVTIEGVYTAVDGSSHLKSNG